MTEYRGYELRWHPVQKLSIHTIGKGALPKTLGGSFTTAAFAKNAIDGYLALKGVKDGETTSSS